MVPIYSLIIHKAILIPALAYERRCENFRKHFRFVEDCLLYKTVKFIFERLSVIASSIYFLDFTCCKWKIQLSWEKQFVHISWNKIWFLLILFSGKIHIKYVTNSHQPLIYILMGFMKCEQIVFLRIIGIFTCNTWNLKSIYYSQ